MPQQMAAQSFPVKLIQVSKVTVQTWKVIQMSKVSVQTLKAMQVSKMAVQTLKTIQVLTVRSKRMVCVLIHQT